MTPKHYAVIGYENNDERYVGNCLHLMAKALVPGTVYGVGHSAEVAIARAKEKAYRARQAKKQ